MKTLISICLLCFSFLAINATDFKEMIRKNPTAAGGEYYKYIYNEHPFSKAPKGYKAFYISHYGRHGSRYHSSDTYMDTVRIVLRKADSLNLLTASGKELLRDIDKLSALHKCKYGQLTELGIHEQQEIAARMYLRTPEVFANKKRNKVVCRTSHYPRCLATMANFMTSLQQHTTNVMAKMYVNDSIQDIVGPYADLKKMFAAEHKIEDSLRTAICKTNGLYSRLFKDAERAKTFIHSDNTFLKYLFNAGSICDNISGAPVILKYFNQEELENLWIVRNVRFYYGFAMSKESPESSVLMAGDLIDDFIRMADEAIKPDSRKSADFRFGHDTVVLPFASLLCLDGLNGRYSALEVSNSFNCTESICMASNVQAIFYKNKQNNILVKFLYNEEERTIPALTPVEGIYYNWTDVKQLIAQKK